MAKTTVFEKIAAFLNAESAVGQSPQQEASSIRSTPMKPLDVTLLRFVQGGDTDAPHPTW